MNYGYHIQVKDSSGKWLYIASFDTNIDRDDCMGFLQDQYEDCEFGAVDDE